MEVKELELEETQQLIWKSEEESPPPQSMLSVTVARVINTLLSARPKKLYDAVSRLYPDPNKKTTSGINYSILVSLFFFFFLCVCVYCSSLNWISFCFLLYRVFGGLSLVFTQVCKRHRWGPGCIWSNPSSHYSTCTIFYAPFVSMKIVFRIFLFCSIRQI